MYINYLNFELTSMAARFTSCWYCLSLTTLLSQCGGRTLGHQTHKEKLKRLQRFCLLMQREHWCNRLSSLGSTLLVKSFAGINFRDFANSLVVRESLYPRNRSVYIIRESLYLWNFSNFWAREIFFLYPRNFLKICFKIFWKM